MVDVSASELERLVAAANARRLRLLEPAPEASSPEPDPERRLEELFQVSSTLAVYGSLAPGRENHHLVSSLGGAWSEGFVEGDVSPDGWGRTGGYPALRPRSGGATVRVHLLVSERLRAAWPRLDRFEGAAYERVLVPVFAAAAAGGRRLDRVANVYALARALRPL